MKELKTAVSRGQDPEKIHNSGEYLKMLAELHELEAKAINQFFKFAETGSLEDLEALKKTIEAHGPACDRMFKERKALIHPFHEAKRRLLINVLYSVDESALGNIEYMMKEMRKEAAECKQR